MQGETVEKTEQEKEKASFDFQEQFDNFKKLRTDWKILHDALVEMRFKLKEMLDKGVHNKKEISVINAQTGELFNDVKTLNLELKNIS